MGVGCVRSRFVRKGLSVGQAQGASEPTSRLNRLLEFYVIGVRVSIAGVPLEVKGGESVLTNNSTRTNPGHDGQNIVAPTVYHSLFL